MLLRSLLPLAFQEQCWRPSASLSAFTKVKPGQPQLAWSEAVASGVLGFLCPQWNLDGIWVQPVQDMFSKEHKLLSSIWL